MFTIDFIGLFITCCIVGIRYPHYVLSAAFVHDVGRILMTLFFNGQLEIVVAAGAFSSITVSSLDAVKSLIVALAGPLSNFIVSAMIGGVEHERTKNLFNPFIQLNHPVAVINLRLAVISLLSVLWHLYW